jgi:transcriptional regulator of arginine metabolism
MLEMANSESKSRLEALKKLLGQGTLSTQDDLREKLEKQGHKVTQSTISRDLRKLGTIKATNAMGQTVYRLSGEVSLPVKATALTDLVLDIKTNGILIVIHTLPGSASLVASHLDQTRPAGILGTLAGDDTIFVALPANKDSKSAMREIEQSFHKY